MNGKRGLGWIPDYPDPRDHKLAFAPKVGLPARFDPRPNIPPIFNQLNTNSCVGNSAAAAFWMTCVKLGLTQFAAGFQNNLAPSREFIYYFCRRLRGWESIDEGAFIRDACIVLEADAVCLESQWPFDVQNINVRPAQTILKDALQNKIKEFEYVRMKRDDDLYHLKHSVVQGYPFLFGISVFESFLSFHTDNTGEVFMPSANDSFLGGHAMYCIGYDDAKKVFICPNSWGTGVGDNGVYYLPYDYFRDEDLSDDFWTMRPKI